MGSTLLTQVRHAPERWLHSARRRTLLESLEQRPLVESVLFICRGNVCRSPFAAALLRSLVTGRYPRVTSAGFGYAGHRAPPAAVQAAAKFGVRLDHHRSELLTPALVRDVALVVVMEPSQARSIHLGFGRAPRDVVILGDLDPEPIATRAIRDPVTEAVGVFEEVYARIDRCVRSLDKTLRSRQR